MYDFNLVKTSGETTGKETDVASRCGPSATLTGEFKSHIKKIELFVLCLSKGLLRKIE